MTRGVAVIGAGMIGAAHAAAYRAHLPAYQQADPALRLLLVCDARAAAATAVAERYGFGETATDWRAVMADERVAIVSVALPNAEHEEVVLAALAAGKNVLCEKPLALSAASARRLEEAAAGSGAVAATMFNYRRMPAVAEMVRRVRDGELGVPLNLRIAYRAQYAADRLLPFSWRYDRAAAGGGAVVDLGTHAVDLALALCGPLGEVTGALQTTTISERQVATGHASGHQHAGLSEERRRVDTDDLFSALLRFENGCHCQFFASRVALGYGNSISFELSATEGSVRFDSERPNCYDVAVPGGDGSVHFQRVHVSAASPYVADHLPVPHDGVTVGYAEAFGFAVADFLDSVVLGKPVAIGSFHDAVLVAEALEAMQLAADHPTHRPGRSPS